MKVLMLPPKGSRPTVREGVILKGTGGSPPLKPGSSLKQPTGLFLNARPSLSPPSPSEALAKEGFAISGKLLLSLILVLATADAVRSFREGYWINHKTGLLRRSYWIKQKADRILYQ
jgi:hypothetical protein